MIVEILTFGAIAAGVIGALLKEPYGRWRERVRQDRAAQQDFERLLEAAGFRLGNVDCSCSAETGHKKCGDYDGYRFKCGDHLAESYDSTMIGWRIAYLSTKRCRHCGKGVYRLADIVQGRIRMVCLACWKCGAIVKDGDLDEGFGTMLKNLTSVMPFLTHRARHESEDADAARLAALEQEHALLKEREGDVEAEIARLRSRLQSGVGGGPFRQLAAPDESEPS